MKRKEKRYLDSGMTNLVLLLCVVYAFFVCVACFKMLNDQVDFGVVASTPKVRWYGE